MASRALNAVVIASLGSRNTEDLQGSKEKRRQLLYHCSVRIRVHNSSNTVAQAILLLHEQALLVRAMEYGRRNDAL